MGELPDSAQKLIKGFLADNAKESYWGQVLTLDKGNSNGKKLKIDENCFFDLNNCKRVSSSEPTQILIGKKTGTIQFLQNWNGELRSRKAVAFPMEICPTNPKQPLPVELRFTYKHWAGQLNFVTTIQKDENSPEGKKNLRIMTVVSHPNEKPVLFSKSTVDIAPMIEAEQKRELAKRLSAAADRQAQQQPAEAAR
jgi:hypothetical protein